MKPNTRGGDAARSATTSAPSPSASSPASTSPTTRPSRAQKRELIAQDYVYIAQAPLRPALEEPQPLPAGERQDPRPVGAAQAGARRTRQPFPYDQRGRGPARARPLHLPGQAGRAVAALPPAADDRRSVLRRGGARGGRVLRRQDHGAPGGHRAVPAGRVAAQLAHRAGAQPRLPRGALRRGGAGRRPALAGHRRAAQGPHAADARPRRDLHHRGGAAALAVVPERRRPT